MRFTPTHTLKTGKRYRYYTSQAALQQPGKGCVVARVPAQEIEKLVISQTHLMLATPTKIIAGLERDPETDVIAERSLDLAKRWTQLDTSKQREFVRNVVRRVVVGKTAIWIEVGRVKLVEALLERKPESANDASKHKRDIIKLTADFRALRRGNELRLEGPTGSCYGGTPVPSLVKAIARARGWYEQIVAGEVGTVTELAQKSGLTSTYVKRILQYAMLSPRITESILSGKHRADLTLQKLLDNIPIDWQGQHDQIIQL